MLSSDQVPAIAQEAAVELETAAAAAAPAIAFVVDESTVVAEAPAATADYAAGAVDEIVEIKASMIRESSWILGFGPYVATDEHPWDLHTSWDQELAFKLRAQQPKRMQLIVTRIGHTRFRKFNWKMMIIYGICKRIINARRSFPMGLPPIPGLPGNKISAQNSTLNS
ncbi:hypothetical protein U1Q18_020503 [Sarracenia purpurea var. burkii]